MRFDIDSHRVGRVEGKSHPLACVRATTTPEALQLRETKYFFVSKPPTQAVSEEHKGSECKGQLSTTSLWAERWGEEGFAILRQGGV